MTLRAGRQRPALSWLSEKFTIAVGEEESNWMFGRHIAEKLGGQLILEKPTMEQWLIDYGREKGLLKEEDISYICTYRIKKDGE